jgi:hypothetical protein
MRWWDASHLRGKDNGLPIATRNPWQVYDEALKFADKGKWSGDGTAAGQDCKILESTADAAMLEAHLKFFVQGNVLAYDGIPDWNWLDVKDASKTSFTYKVWIGKEDLLVWRMESALTMGIDAKKKPELDLPSKIEMKWSYDISDYDKDLDLSIPKEVKSRFGLKD